MPQENKAFSSIQQELLVPAFEAIAALLKENGVPATVSSTDDSRVVTFVGKNGRECKYGCRIHADGARRIYEFYVRPASDHGERGKDTFGVFTKDINPETIVRSFKSHFRFHI